MRAISRLLALWRNLFRHARVERELDEEMRAMHDLLLDEGGEHGLAPTAARRQASIAFGGVDQVKEHVRDVRAGALLDSIAQDLIYAVRGLRKDPAFTAAAVLALALGIGVNNTQFTIVNALCIRGLPIVDPDRVVYVATRDARDRDRGLSARDFEDLRSGTQALTGMAAFTGGPTVLGDEGHAPDRVIGMYISANAFRLIREQPLLGRDFAAEDDRRGAPAVVIVSSGVWNRRYGADPAAIGRLVTVGGAPATIIGVMPGRFKFPNNADVWQPLAVMPGYEQQPRDARTLGVFGRLADGATMAQSRAELGAGAARLARAFPDTNTGIRATVVPINERYNGRITDPAWLAFTTAGALVVLIACANVANLLLMRSTRRAREMAIRASLGATRRRIVRQLLIESGVLAALGGIVGLGLSAVGVRLFASALPEDGLPYWVQLTMDGRVLLVLVAVCLGTVMIFGLAPALQVAKTDVNQVLKDGGRLGGTARARRWTAGFLTLEFALAVILIAAAVDGLRSDRAAERADVRIDTSQLITMWVTLPPQKYPTPDQRMAFYERVHDRVRAISAISSATMTSALPFGGASQRQLDIAGRPSIAGDTPPTVWTVTIDPRYFETIGLPLTRGRVFEDLDGSAGHESAIVNQRFVDLHVPGTDPIGQRIRLAVDTKTGAPAPWLTIVGVSPNMRQRWQPVPDAVVYLPFRLSPPATTALILRSPSQPAAITPLLREELRALDPGLPLYRVMTMEQSLRESGWNGRVSRALISVITSIAVLLSLVGLHAVTAYAVSQRTQEIGVRMALGARASHVMWLVLRRAIVQLGAGLIGGIGLTWVWARLLGDASGQDGSSMTDTMTLSWVAAVLIVLGLAASIQPARRATRLDPVAVLRHE